MRTRLACAALGAVLSGVLMSCGTILNLAGYEERRPAQDGPDKGRVVSVPQAAIMGGSRLDMVMGYATKLGPSWPFPDDHSFSGNMIYCAVGYWPPPPVCCLILDLPLSFVLDIVLLPITALLTDSDPKNWPTWGDPSPAGPRRDR